MSRRPPDDEFIEWVKKDENKSKVQNALKEHSDLANIKGWVSMNQIYMIRYFNFTMTLIDLCVYFNISADILQYFILLFLCYDNYIRVDSHLFISPLLTIVKNVWHYYYPMELMVT